MAITHESTDILYYEDGTVWNNPNYENWFQAYAGKETDVAKLQNYYPHEYKID